MPVVELLLEGVTGWDGRFSPRFSGVQRVTPLGRWEIKLPLSLFGTSFVCLRCWNFVATTLRRVGHAMVGCPCYRPFQM